MERITDRDQIELVYPHVKFTNVSSNLHLKPFLVQGKSKSINSYALKRGTVVETGPFFLTHLSVAHLLYLGIGVELFQDEYTSLVMETTDDLVKIATFASQR